MARAKRPHVDRDPDLPHVYGARLRAAPLHQGIMQEELAARSSPVTTFISACENGRRNPSLISLRRLAAALDNPAAYLIQVWTTAREWGSHGDT